MVQAKVFQKYKVVAPQKVAQSAYQALMRGDRLHAPGAMNKALVFSRRLTSLPAQTRLNKSFYEEAPPDKRKRRQGGVEREPIPAHRRERLRR